MELMEIVKKRRSIRKYKTTLVDEELIMQLLKCASLAPSGCNKQPWHFIIVDDAGLKEAIAEVSHQQKWMLSAPVFIVCAADIRARLNSEDEVALDEESSFFELKLVIRDTAIAVEHLVLEAEENGLGTCWVGWYQQSEIRSILGIPDDKYVVGIVTVGYADEAPEPRPRKKIEDLIHRNQW